MVRLPFVQYAPDCFEAMNFQENVKFAAARPRPRKFVEFEAVALMRVIVHGPLKGGLTEAKFLARFQ
jgi:hypothetical protein